MSCHVYHIWLYYHFHLLGEFDLVWQKRHIPCADLFCTKSPNSQHTHGRVQNTVYTGWQIGVRLIMRDESITYLKYEWYGGFQNHTYNLRLWYTHQTLLQLWNLYDVNHTEWQFALIIFRCVHEIPECYLNISFTFDYLYIYITDYD